MDGAWLAPGSAAGKRGPDRRASRRSTSDDDAAKSSAVACGAAHRHGLARRTSAAPSTDARRRHSGSLCTMNLYRCPSASRPSDTV